MRPARGERPLLPATLLVAAALAAASLPGCASSPSTHDPTASAAPAAPAAAPAEPQQRAPTLEEILAANADVIPQLDSLPIDRRPTAAERAASRSPRAGEDPGAAVCREAARHDPTHGHTNSAIVAADNDPIPLDTIAAIFDPAPSPVIGLAPPTGAATARARDRSTTAALTPDQRIDRAAAELAAALLDAAPAAESPTATLAALGALELLTPAAMPDPRALPYLTPREAEVLEVWRDAFRAARDRFASDPNDVLSLHAALSSLADRLASFEPLRMTQTRLCTRVDGFGKYTPIAGDSLLAGRAHPLIVYAELERFATRPAALEDGAQGWQVELTQDISLYHDADGLLAWRAGEQVIEDTSRTKWRDFYLVHVIELPQTLTVGRYRLKITTRDRLNNNATAETTIPLNIVADPRLTSTTGLISTP